MRRMWVNQPSDLQAHHNLHGVNVLAETETDQIFRVWFLSGSIHSMQLPRVALSEGWTNNG